MSPKKKFPLRAFRVPGFRASSVRCGIKKAARKKDLALILSDVPARVAGVFTRNRVKAAPVLLDKERVLKGRSRGVVVTAGNANACTGGKGYRDAEATAAFVEEALGLARGEILVCSTGVIGVPLPVDKVRFGVPALVEALDYGGFKGAAEAITTTDAFPKSAVARAKIGGKTVTIGGIAKGAGMVCPDMATMLAFFVTDANITTGALKKALRQACDLSFNSIMVDNDTSTNDTVLVFANALSGCKEIKPRGAAFDAFSELLGRVALELAHLIVRDGEGATRFVEIVVSGARSEKEARRAARTIAGSFLVKTALFGGDPNWGRILAALGRSGVRIKESSVDVSLNGVPVVAEGLDTGAEKQAARAMDKKEVTIAVDLNMGGASYRFWTTDLTYAYVRINSMYRT
ncbi:MAG TPA: bifunctional glutamate N-acetyltransferase/amino-acid acetyltransferase ArgJ [Thermodesulfobacteriota bacterium]|nr:bifunctional glutamate N-acetyltransferase/amino-acid acetyltransferase ArgJ [Thermodesulfobacteriota bacterium]